MDFAFVKHPGRRAGLCFMYLCVLRTGTFGPGLFYLFLLEECLVFATGDGEKLEIDGSFGRSARRMEEVKAWWTRCATGNGVRLGSNLVGQYHKSFHFLSKPRSRYLDCGDGISIA